MNIQGKILSIVEGKLKAYEDLVLPGKVVEAVPNGTYFVLKGREKTQYWFPRLSWGLKQDARCVIQPRATPSWGPSAY